MGNRIKELRDARGWTQEMLAERMGTSQQHLGRLERETRRLNTDWLERAARALEVRIEDLLDTDDEDGPDVSAVADDATLTPIARALGTKSVCLFRVDTDVVVDSGVLQDSIIPVDKSPDAITEAKTGDVVLVAAGLEDKRLLLRVLVRPSLVTTNRPGVNTCFRLDNPSIGAEIAGVVMRD
jgi:transcriptional regulator with XRE-family HTH domain